MVFLNKNSFANIVRSTTFDDRFACEKSRGSWRDFGNSCADKCTYKFDKYAVCAYAIRYGCDCGKNRCLHEDKCISVSEYKKIDDAQEVVRVDSDGAEGRVCSGGLLSCVYTFIFLCVCVLCCV